MDVEQSVDALVNKHELIQQKDLLETMLSEGKEIVGQMERMLSSNNDTLKEVTVGSLSGSQLLSPLQNTFERQVRGDLQPTRLIREQRTSSPVDFKSFIQNSVSADSSESAEFQSCKADFPLEVKGPDSLLGEIAFQLDKRVLSHVFLNRERIYGFTLINIPEKIREMSTHPLTGKLNKGSQLYLTQRYTDLMETLSQFGYKTAFHPLFTDFIVHTYGILIERPGENSTRAIDYNNPDLLRKLTMNTAPRQLQKDLMVVLTCLCNMAEKDRKPLFL